MKPKRRDFRLDIIVLLGFTAAATIASFGVYRMWVGEWTKAWFDLAVVAAVAAPVIHAWRGGDSLRAGNVLAAGRPAEIVENESVRRVYLGEHFKL